MPDTIALITVLFNSEIVLEGFFKSLSIQTFKGYHLFMIDNSPQGKHEEVIKELAHKYSNIKFTYLSNDRNVGVAAGNNQGIRLSLDRGFQYTILLNNDIEFEQETLLEEIHQQAVNNNEYMITPKILYFDSRKVWMAGGYLLKNKGIVYHVGDRDDDGDRYNQPSYFNYAPTCFMLIDNRVFEEVGLMDEQYFVYYDDTDFVYRASRKNYRIFYMPSLCVLHKVSSSTGGGESGFSIYYNTRNRIYFIRKNFYFFHRIIPMLYTIITRAIRYFVYNSHQRKNLREAFFAGFRMPVDKATI